MSKRAVNYYLIGMIIVLLFMIAVVYIAVSSIRGAAL